jgi:hypothetical protein
MIYRRRAGWAAFTQPMRAAQRLLRGLGELLGGGDGVARLRLDDADGEAA